MTSAGSSRLLRISFVVLVIVCCFAATSSSQTPVVFTNNFYGTQPTQSQVGDMNGDGHPDVVSASGPNVNVLLNDGTGLFIGPGAVYAAGGNLAGVALGDFNRDGKLDVAAADSASQSVVIMLNNGDGSLTKSTTLVGVGTPSTVVVADFNADGLPDIAIAYSNHPEITVWFNLGSSWSAPANVSSGVSYITSLSAGDINADGKPDLAAIGCCGQATSGGTVATLKLINTTPTGSTTASFSSSIVEVGTADSVTLVDIDKDGHADFLVPYSPKDFCVTPCNNSGVTWIFNNPDGSTTKGGYSFVSQNNWYKGLGGATVGDFNNDGRNDIALSIAGSGSTTEDQVRYLLATGPRTFAPVQPSDMAFRQLPRQLLSVDVNGDHQVDIIAADLAGGNTDVKMAVVGDPGFGNGTSLYCPAPTSGWNVCTPTPGQNEPFVDVHFQGTATAPSGQSVLSTQLFIDGQIYDTTNDRSMIAFQELASAGTHTATFRAILSGGSNMDDTITFTVGGSSGGSGCAVPSTATVAICSPAPNSTVTSPVTFSGAAGAPSGQKITAMKIYIDGTAKATSSSNTISASLSLTTGTHKATFKGWTNTGAVESSTEYFTVGSATSGGGGGTGSCIPTAAQTTNICSPIANSTVSSPFTLVAGSRAASGSFIYSMKVYLDGVAYKTFTNPTYHGSTEQISTSVSLAAGDHYVTVVTYENNSMTMKERILVHVQ